MGYVSLFKIIIRLRNYADAQFSILFLLQRNVVKIVKAQTKRRIKEQIKTVRSVENRQKLLDEGSRVEEVDWIIKNKVRELKREIRAMKCPSVRTIIYAIERASAEIKYIFGVMGLTARTFCHLVIDLDISSIFCLRTYWDSRMETLDMPTTPFGAQCKLHCFLTWYDNFLHFKGHVPVVENDFTKEVWLQYNAIGIDMFVPMDIHHRDGNHWTEHSEAYDPFYAYEEGYQHYSEVEMLCEIYDSQRNNGVGPSQKTMTMVAWMRQP